MITDMNEVQVLIDKKANHDCNTDGGTCTYCEQINAEIYALSVDEEPMVAWHLTREK